MSNKVILIWSIAWILGSVVWVFLAENTVIGIAWLCCGIVELIYALVRRNKEKKSK